MGRRARRMHGHAILVGLGDVGYRVEHLLAELGVPRVGVDVTGGEAFTEVIQERTPVITGDVRAPETLQRAGVEDAVCLFALTSDDITNVGACLRARRANPRIRTVARIFDETLATRVSGTMGIDVALSATRVAASVFVDAAIDERASRTSELGNVRYLAFRHD